MLSGHMGQPGSLSENEIERIHTLVLDLASVERREQVRYVSIFH